MGGLIAVLQGRGFSPVALTPERTQIQYVRRTYPDVPAIHAKFEELAGSEHADHAGRYGTVITSESLQYLKLDQSLPLIASLLKPGGRWIACDCFQISGAAPSARESGTFSAGLTATKGRLNKTGHDWDTFRRAVDRAGWYIAYERDITPNVLPTLRCLYMSGLRFGLPAFQFAVDKLRRKQPGIHYMLAEVMEELHAVLVDNLEIVNPNTFAEQSKYVLMVMVSPNPKIIAESKAP